ncbi:hypothetical protein HYX18_04130 [Candidatus Woesearchaeota archaeon]|nr:hypothetical protein [Candidatus Woesearchaeota archaeon]
MNKRVAFTILIISSLFLLFLTLFGGSNALVGLAIKNAKIPYDNFVFGIFILLIGLIIATGYYLKQQSK